MKCPLCHSEDTTEATDFILCFTCGRVYLKASDKRDRLDKIVTDHELAQLVMDVERGVNRP